MKRNPLPVLAIVVGVLAAAIIAAGGPILWALVAMGLPFIALFVVLGGIAHSHADNGHFRRPER